MSKNKVGHIKIDFNSKGQATFDIETSDDGQIISAIMGLEGYLAARTGLDCTDIREIVDEHKKKVNVLPVGKGE